MVARPRGDLDEVFRAEYARVVAVAQRVTGDRQSAEDVAQEVFLGFAGSDVPRPAAARWLTVASAHTALNHLRGEQRRTGRELKADGDPSLGPGATTPDAADLALANLERQRLGRALAALPRPQALAVVLKHTGMSYADIAEILGIAPSGVGTTVRRAEAALRQELTRDQASR